MVKKAEGILKKIFGYRSFRPLQKEVIENVTSKKDTLVIMPTGGGKSLTYQIPALIFDGITIVVSPLISLMKDQVEQLKELGVEALFLNSSLSQLDYQYNVEQVKRGASLISTVYKLSKVEEMNESSQPIEVYKILERGQVDIIKTEMGTTLNFESEAINGRWLLYESVVF